MANLTEDQIEFFTNCMVVIVAFATVAFLLIRRE